MGYIDSNADDGDLTRRREARREAEARRDRRASGRQTFDDAVFERSSTYNGTPAQRARLAARVGRR